MGSGSVFKWKRGGCGTKGKGDTERRSWSKGSGDRRGWDIGRRHKGWRRRINVHFIIVNRWVLPFVVHGCHHNITILFEINVARVAHNSRK
jgi:hypothetical protein